LRKRPYRSARWALSQGNMGLSTFFTSRFYSLVP